MKFSITGKVQTGQAVGHTIGFPTANLDKIPSETDLTPGVYAGKCWIKPSPLGGEGLESETCEDARGEACLAYFGPRHIFGESKNVFEVHILDFDQDIVGQELTVKLTNFIRSPKKPKNLAELKKQLEKDKVTTLGLKSRHSL